MRILKQRVQQTLSKLNRAVTDNDLTLAVQLQQNLADQLTQLEEQTFAAIDLAESTDEQDSLTDDLLQVTLEADSLKLQVLELSNKRTNPFTVDHPHEGSAITTALPAEAVDGNGITQLNSQAIDGQDTNLGVDTALDSSGRQADQPTEPIHYSQLASAQATVARCTEFRGSNGDNIPSTSSANAPPFPPMVQQPYIFNPFSQSLPQLQLDPFDGNPLKWSDWSSRFQFMIGNTQMTNDQKIAYLHGLTKGRAKETIEAFKCNGDLFHRAMEELRLGFGQPTLIVNSFIEKVISYAPPVPSQPERYSSISYFLNAMVHTFKEHKF